MNVLVDTHAVLWWLAGSGRLSRRAKLILGDAANRRLVSMVSLWEIAIKIGSGRLPTGGLTLKDLVDELIKQRFELRSVEPGDLFRLETLPQLHRDPFDRLLVAQAIEDGVPLLTVDGAIAQYPVQTVW
jgi:PIN domain nuclease of toxin-antitoxin system